MRVATHRPRLAQMLERRCFFLMLALIGLLVAVPFLSETAYGRVILILVNIAVLLTAVAAVRRTRFSLVIAVLLVVPAVAFRFLAHESQPEYIALASGFNAAFYIFVLIHLLYYVLRRDFMTEDKLYGAVAAYILIAILWANLYNLVQFFYPNAYALGGTPTTLNTTELIYFSFTALTTAGFGDITPLLVQSRFLTILEMVTGVMYVAILIARLTGVYPTPEEKR